jgi:hypothetical protein
METVSSSHYFIAMLIAKLTSSQPAARAELLETIASSEFHLGHLDRAERLDREALRLRIQLDGKNSPRVAGLLNDLGLVRKHQDHLDDAERMLRDSIVDP